MMRLTAATIALLAPAVWGGHNVNPGGYCAFHTPIASCTEVNPGGGTKCTDYMQVSSGGLPPTMCISGNTCVSNGAQCMAEPGDSPPRAPASLARTPLTQSAAAPRRPRRRSLGLTRAA